MYISVSRLKAWAVPIAAAAIFLGGAFTLSTYGNFGFAVFLLLILCVAAGLSWSRPIASLVAIVPSVTIGTVAESVIVAWRINIGWFSAVLAVALCVGVVAARHRSLRWIALAITPGAGIASAAWWNGRTLFDNLAIFVFCTAIAAAAWGVGVAIRENSARIAAFTQAARLETRLETTESSLSLADERNRLAQEMHDVVAHSLAVIVAQADGARYLKDARPQAMADALEAISGSARSALLDVQGMIDGMLDGTEAPQPTLEQLPDLVEGSRGAGLDVTQVTAGEPAALGLAQQAAAYRIVQEGLTNALRHRGRGSAVSLVFDWRGPGLSIQLVSSGEGEQSALETRGSGRGVTGMQERARLAGGWLADGADESGDHRLTAFIPYRELDAEEHLAAATGPLPAAAASSAAPSSPAPAGAAPRPAAPGALA
ncbi:hypothetical protein FJ656_00400 [Schumannella luteola]|uniref:histidine kinase n=1 Tax=Schumannella luteola TaxID=472059 RepID=A0A852YFM1_9MICO|nr:histidine kinase [Schumannella luteola]NYH00091.1 signal transduction histidine kinase [Schumannella luteola]TPX06643.1 hypothetical protein FJ656_00400 [Schumannella luteola]